MFAGHPVKNTMTPPSSLRPSSLLSTFLLVIVIFVIPTQASFINLASVPCGLSKVASRTPKVIGGRPAQPGQFPWTARNYWTCLSTFLTMWHLCKRTSDQVTVIVWSMFEKSLVFGREAEEAGGPSTTAPAASWPPDTSWRRPTACSGPRRLTGRSSSESTDLTQPTRGNRWSR